MNERQGSRLLCVLTCCTSHAHDQMHFTDTSDRHAAVHKTSTSDLWTSHLRRIRTSRFPQLFSPYEKKQEEATEIIIYYLFKPLFQAVLSGPAGSFCCMSLSLLLLLALLLLGVVHADGERAGLRPVLVLDQEGVLAGVGLGDGGDGDAGELAVLVRELVVVIAQQLLLVLRPADLGLGVAPHVSSQVQGLKTGGGKKRIT